MAIKKKNEYKVKRVDYNSNIKICKFCDGTQLKLCRFACVGEEDVVVIPGTGRLYVKCLNGLAQLKPIYRAYESVKIGQKLIKVTFKEIQKTNEFEGYRRLLDFHYRGAELHGRHVPIIATTDYPFLPKVIGYVELATSFIMSKPRNQLLHAPFSDGYSISWDRWDLRAMQTKTNLITRIARCVIYPELRGLGFSRLLLKHAFRYAAKHWQVGGLKPYFIEITADMLKYLPFAEKSGMHFIGYTEGNLSRVHRDMSYITKNYERVKRGEILREDSVGVVDLQVSYATKLKHVVDNGGPGLKTILRLMQFKGNRVNSRQYHLLHGLLRLPKPTYLKGLTPMAENFVLKRINELGIKKENFDAKVHVEPISSSILLSNLTISINSRVRKTAKSRAVQESFGIKPESLKYNIISDLSLEIHPKSTLLIVGPSGAGKTILLSAITGKFNDIKRNRSSRLEKKGEIQLPANMKAGTLAQNIQDKPLIELYGGSDIKRAVYILNMAGLSEAYLYLKRFSELSAGEQYRAMIAKTIDSERNVWVADEFCSTLDPVTTHIVAQNMKRLSIKFGATLIVAAPHWNYFIDVLEPDIVIYLMSSREHRVFTGKEFIKHSKTLEGLNSRLNR